MLVARFYCMQSLDCDLFHRVGECVLAVACEPVDNEIRINQPAGATLIEQDPYVIVAHRQAAQRTPSYAHSRGVACLIASRQIEETYRALT